MFYLSACKSSVWIDLRKQPSRTPVHRASVSTDNLAFPNCANHRSLSRPPSRRQPFPSRSLKTRAGRRSGNRAGPPPKCHQDLIVLWRSLYAAAAMTSCKRGVSDLDCGRGHNRRRGHISWSLTPRLPSVSRAGQPCAYRAAEGAARILRSETTGPAGVTALKRCRTDFGIGHPDRQGRCQEGEHPAQRPVPPFVPLSA